MLDCLQPESRDHPRISRILRTGILPVVGSMLYKYKNKQISKSSLMYPLQGGGEDGVT